MTSLGNFSETVGWAARVLVVFVFFGGFVGGLVIGVGLPMIALATSWSGGFSLGWLVQFPFFVAFAALYGVAIGLPASLLTGLAYLVNREAMRRRAPLMAVGTMGSAAWGVLLAELLSSSSAPLESYVALGGLFALCGALATLACFWLLARWNLHRSV